jgi:hypothetical protein
MAQIDKPNLHFNTKLYTGNGSTQSITGVGFQPDWVWLKDRNDTSSHRLYDVVRGVTKRIQSNTTAAEATEADGLTAFGTDGFTLGSNAATNANSTTYVSWNWKAGNSQGSSNTDGTINTTYTSVNSTAKFSISQYTGTGSNATFGHGLGVAPTFCIHKETSSTGPWFVSNVARTGDTGYMYLDQDIQGSASGQAFYTAKPTASLINLGTDNDINQSGQTYIAYCFAEVKGFSKFGIYSGNNNNGNGPFIYTGFKPAWVMIKGYSNNSRFWTMQDNKRSSVGGPNPNDKWLYANASDAEYDASSYTMDFLSNGFKIRHNGNYQNASESYMFMAFAAQPLVGSNNVPATAE